MNNLYNNSSYLVSKSCQKQYFINIQPYNTKEKHSSTIQIGPKENLIKTIPSLEAYIPGI